MIILEIPATYTIDDVVAFVVILKTGGTYIIDTYLLIELIHRYYQDHYLNSNNHSTESSKTKDKAVAEIIT